MRPKLSEIQNLIKKKIDNINSVIERVETEQTAILGLLDNKKTEIQGLKKQKFDHVRSLIGKKEEEAWSEIELLFARKKTKDEQLKQQWHIDLTMLNKKKMDQKFFDTLNKEISEKCTLKDEKENIDVLSTKLVNEFKTSSENLNKSLITFFNESRPRIGVAQGIDIDSEKNDIADCLRVQVASLFEIIVSNA